MPLTTAEAKTVIAAAHARAQELGIRVTVAVVDEGGLLFALARMDGAPPLSSQVAEAKACGAAVFHRDGGMLAQLAQDRPQFFEAATRLTRLPLMPAQGSVLIKVNGNIVGAVGISGGKPDQDLDCAEVGLKAIAK